MKIDTLTKAQIAKLPEYRDKWIKIGLSCEPMDFEAAKLAIEKIYLSVGFESPKRISRFRSPFEATKCDYIIQNNVEQVWESIVGQVWNSVREQVDINKIYFLWNILWNAWDSVEEQVYNPVWVRNEQKKSQKNACRQVMMNISSQLKDIGFFDFFNTELDLSCLQPFDGMLKLAQHCGGWMLYRHNVLLLDRPEWIHRDEQGRLHSENEMAIRYRDGYGLYQWHGITIPGEWIEKRPPHAKKLLRRNNIEQRRVGIEILGWEVILKELNAKLINQSDNPQIGSLYQSKVSGFRNRRFLKVQCGTGRHFVIPVPSYCKSAHQANAWSYGLEPETYQPEVRT